MHPKKTTEAITTTTHTHTHTHTDTHTHTYTHTHFQYAFIDRHYVMSAAGRYLGWAWPAKLILLWWERALMQSRDAEAKYTAAHYTQRLCIQVRDSWDAGLHCNAVHYEMYSSALKSRQGQIDWSGLTGSQTDRRRSDLLISRRVCSGRDPTSTNRSQIF